MEKGTVFPGLSLILYYAYQQGEVAQDNYSKRLTDSEGFLHYMQKVKRYMAESGIEETYPVYVTEWNLTISDRNYINDTCFKGAYVVKIFWTAIHCARVWHCFREVTGSRNTTILTICFMEARELLQGWNIKTGRLCL